MTDYAVQVERDAEGRAVRMALQRVEESPDEAQGYPSPEKSVTGEPARLRAKECAVCHRVYVPQRRGQAYCSGGCYQRAYNAAHPVRRAGQRALPGESRVERAFAEWIQSPPGRYVEREVIRLAREDKAQGDRRGEMNLYLALVRRSSRGLTRDAAGFRCSNNHRSLLARRVMGNNPDLEGFFELRALRGVRG